MHAFFWVYQINHYGMPLPGYFAQWEDIIDELPELIKSREVRNKVRELPLLEVNEENLQREEDWWRAYVALSQGCDEVVSILLQFQFPGSHTLLQPMHLVATNWRHCLLPPATSTVTRLWHTCYKFDFLYGYCNMYRFRSIRRCSWLVATLD